MAKSSTRKLLRELEKALKQLEAHPLPMDTRAALQMARQELDALNKALPLDQEHARLAALYQVTQVLGTSLDLDEVLTQVMDAVIGLTGAERGFLVLQEAETGAWHLQAARNYSQENLRPKDMEISRTVINTVIENGKGLVTTDAQTDPRFAQQDSVVFYALRSILCAPLLLRGKPIGAIYVDNRAQAGLFNRDDLEMLSAFAIQAAIAIDNARLYTRTDQALARRIAELETLAQIDRELNNRLDIDHVVEITCKWAREVAKAQQTWVLLTDGGGELTCYPAEPAAPAADLVSLALKEGSPHTSAAKVPPFYLAAPLQHSGRTLGAVLLERQESFIASDYQFLGYLCGRAASAIENSLLYQAVQQANQAKTKFVSVVTHELRIPMTSIKGYTDLLRQGTVGPINEQQLNFLNVIRNNVERMSALVSDLSDISRIEAGRLKLECSLVSVQEYLDETICSLGPKLEEKGQALKVEIPQDLPKVYADPNRLMQVLTNLLSNAWKYSPPGGEIQILARPDGEMVRLEIIDNGIGISPEDQAMLFEQFFRSEDAAVREQQGWGLGLNVAKRLVEIMGGTIGFSTRPGHGSTFWFTLPTREGECSS
jgi:signal transduction histidine kinase